jgi:MFS family permease
VSEGQPTRAHDGKERLPLVALVGASAVSEIGSVLSALAIPWFVLQTTGSASKTGLVVAATVLAFVLAGFFGGPMVDRLGLKRTSVAADLLSGLTVAAVPLLHAAVGIAFWQLLALVFLKSLLGAPGKTARQGLLPGLAANAGTPLARANSSYQGAGRLAQLLGPPLAGVSIAALGPTNVLWLDAGTYFFSAVAVLVAVPTAERPQREPSRAEGYARELTEGLRFVRRNRLVLWVVLTYTLTEFLDAPVISVVLPVYADRIFGDPVALGTMLASVGGGALAGSAVYGAIGHRLPRWPTFIGSLVVLQLPFWALATAPSLPLAVAALAVTGFAAGPLNVLLYALIQERTPEGMLGRVFGAFSACGMAAVPLGMVACGYLLDAAGLVTTLIGIAGCYLAVTLVLIATPALREMEPGVGSDRETTDSGESPVLRARTAEERSVRAQPDSRMSGDR